MINISKPFRNLIMIIPATASSATNSNYWATKSHLLPHSLSSSSSCTSLKDPRSFVPSSSSNSRISMSTSKFSVLNFPKQITYQNTIPPTILIPKEDTCSSSVNNDEVSQSTFPFPTKSDKVSTTKAPQKWNLLQRTAATALDMVEDALVSRERQSPLPKTADPAVQISGNFSPVSEQPVQHSLPVTGKIPECINGVYVRNGANPLFAPVSGHHFFDGDGMIHAVKINGGSASYSCRYTETERLVQERELGRPIFPKSIGELHGHTGVARLLLFYARGMFGLLDHSKGTGVANAGLVYFNGRLLAMSEDDIPYHVGITPAGDLKTVGRFDFDGQLKTSMIAHPKLDPETKEMYALSYDVIKKPYLKYFKFSQNGEKSPDVEIPVKEPTMMHDFAITKNFVVIQDHQVVFKLQEMVRGGNPVVYDKNKVSRFGILPKNCGNNGDGQTGSGSTDIIWVDCPDTFCFHLWNAWEETDTDEIVVIGSCMTPPDSVFNEHDENLKSVLSEIRLNMKTGKSTRRPIIQNPGDHVNLEAGMVNKNLLGRKTRYAYLAIAEPWPKVSGFAKVDLITGEVKKFDYGDQRFGGEPLFLPRPGSDDDLEEDDGFVVAFVHDEKAWKSNLLVVNAMTLEVEASVELPSRVPYGFHGTFVDAADLSRQVV